MDDKPEITEDMKVADARANITALISRVQLLRWTVFLINRRTPMAAIVPIGLGQLARDAGGADKLIEAAATQLGLDPAKYRG